MRDYARQVLRPDSNVAEREEAIQASKLSVKEKAALASRRLVDSCTVLPKLVSVKRFSVQIIHSLGNMYKGSTFLEKCWHISL